MARTETIPSRNASHTVNAKNAPNPLAVASGSASDGETAGVGTVYGATLSERENKSLNRNGGPERPSANLAEIPVVTKGVRKTGRI